MYYIDMYMYVLHYTVYIILYYAAVASRARLMKHTPPQGMANRVFIPRTPIEEPGNDGMPIQKLHSIME